MGPRRRLTIREALELSPWAKWLLYGIVPWKMILHLLLVFFITLQVSQSARQVSQPPLVLDSAPASPNLDRDPPIHRSQQPARRPTTHPHMTSTYTHSTGEPGQRTLRRVLPRGGPELPEPLLPDGAGHDGPGRLPLLHLYHQRHHPARPPAARHVLRGGRGFNRSASCIHEMKPHPYPTNQPANQPTKTAAGGLGRRSRSRPAHRRRRRRHYRGGLPHLGGAQGTRLAPLDRQEGEQQHRQQRRWLHPPPPRHHPRLPRARGPAGGVRGGERVGALAAAGGRAGGRLAEGGGAGPELAAAARLFRLAPLGDL